jgi:hypothetical protein
MTAEAVAHNKINIYYDKDHFRAELREEVP